MPNTQPSCARCFGDAGTGAGLTLTGPATGHNTERRLLCEFCVRAFHEFLKQSEHVQASDQVTAAGLAHIDACPECRARFGGVHGRTVSRETCDGSSRCKAPVHIEGCFATNPDYAPRVVSKEDVAARFLEGGRAQ